MVAQNRAVDNLRLWQVDLSEGLKELHKALNRPNTETTPSGAEYELDRAEVARLLDEAGDHNAAFRFEHCGEAGLGWVGVCTDDPNHDTRYHPFSCMQRICPTCASKRSAQLAREITEPIRQLAARAPHYYTLKHIVLTSNVSLDDDPELVRQLAQRWRRDIRRMFQKRWPGDSWLGGLIGFEFGEAGRKLHYHCLVLSKFYPQKDLSDDWRKITAGRGYIVHVTKVDDTELSSAVNEVCKYATKPLKFAGEDESIEQTLVKVHFVIKGVRRAQPFGSFYKLERVKDESECTCPECGSDLHWISELEWMISEHHAEDVQARLNLIQANNLHDRAPPTTANNLQLPLLECLP